MPIVAILVVVYAILMVLLPVYVWAINGHVRRINQKMDRIIRIFEGAAKKTKKRTVSV
jgi:hypothetical protein